MKFILKTILLGIVMLVGAQLIPYGKNHTNPPIVKEPSWNSPATRQLVKIACFDCHSNETAWPWYSRIAPISWLVYWDVVQGREHLNFSEWNGGNRKGENVREITKEVSEGEMPPLQYTIAHPKAKLDEQSKKALVHGLEATVAASQR